MRAALPVLLVFLLVSSLTACEEVRHEGKTPAEWATTLATEEKRFRIPAAEALNVHLWPYAASAVPHLVAALDSEDGEVRQLAAACLGHIGAPARGDPAAKVATLLQDEASHVHCAAATALGQIADPASVPALRAALDSDDAALRACAARGLGLYGVLARDTVPALTTLLEDDDERVRLRAALARLRLTEELEPSRAVILAALLPPPGAISRQQVYLREEAIQTLGDIGASAGDFAPALTEIVKNDRGFARDFAAQALPRLGQAGQVGIPALVEGLGDSTFRQAAARALGAFGPAAKSAVPGLVRLLERPTWKEESQVATRALGRIGPDAASAVPALVKILAQGNHSRSEAVLVALGDIGSAARTSVEAIRPFLGAEAGTVRVAAVRALYLVTGTDGEQALEALTSALRSGDADTRAAGATALAGLGLATDETRKILMALEDGDSSASVRRAAAATLARSED